MGVGLLVPGLAVLEVHGLCLEVDGLLGPSLVLDDVIVALGLSLEGVDGDAFALDAALGLGLALLFAPGLGWKGVAWTG